MAFLFGCGKGKRKIERDSRCVLSYLTRMHKGRNQDEVSVSAVILSRTLMKNVQQPLGCLVGGKAMSNIRFARSHILKWMYT